jgi:hypothetical protein
VNLIPVNEALLRRTSALMVSAPRDLFVRTADAVHFSTAHEIGERAVWTNNRHMLAAAAYLGLTGQSVRASSRRGVSNRFLWVRLCQ